LLHKETGRACVNGTITIAILNVVKNINTKEAKPINAAIAIM